MTEAAGPASPLRALTAGAVLVQAVVLYLPSAPGGVAFPGADKVVHVLVFLVPVVLALLAGLPRWPVVAGSVVHAGVSEVLQWAVLSGRSGDPWDVVADLAGVGLGVALARALSASGPGRGRW